MKKLRIGLVIGEDGPQAWHEPVISLLLQDANIDLLGLYRRSHTDASLWTSARLVWSWLDWIETVVAGKLFKTPNALTRLPLKRLAAPPLFDLEELMENVDSENLLDLLILLDGPSVDDRLPRDLVHGVWYLTFDERDHRPETIGLASWYHQDDVVNVTLWQAGAQSIERSNEASDQAIERAHLGVFKQSWSINRSRLLWKATLIIADNIGRLARSPSGIARHRPAASLPPASANDDQLPGGGRLVARWLARVGAHIWYKIAYVEQWRILASNRSDNMFAPKTYAQLRPPCDRFWADPFAVQRDGKDYIFVEELRYKSRKGDIAVLEHRDGKLLRTTTIITQPYHMSYPYIFEHEGDLFMVPETRKNRTIEIWRNTSFPDTWVRDSNLMTDVSAGDTTLFHHDGHWWMFTNLSRISALRTADELHAFYTSAPSPIGAVWQAHQQNPLVRDTRCARQGGRVFVDDEGRLIRCAQDTAVRYGYAVLFFHVETLAPGGFSETLLHKVEPDWHDEVVGHHTFERCGDLCVFDACFVKKKFPFLAGWR